MYPLIESIRIEDGKPQHLNYHQNRMNDGFIKQFNLNCQLSIKDLVDCPKELSKGIVKCRIVYDNKSYTIHYSKYSINQIQAFKLIEANDINYKFKFEDRKDLDLLYDQIGPSCQDMIIVKNGVITDSYYANLVFRKGKDLFTPSQPLLMGTMRQFLIDMDQVEEIPIKCVDLDYFDSFTRINAMMPLGSDSWYAMDDLKK